MSVDLTGGPRFVYYSWIKVVIAIAAPISEEKLRHLWTKIVRTARGVVGIPDYDLYREHYLKTHGCEPPQSREDFYRCEIDRRYGDGSGSMRCC